MKAIWRQEVRNGFKPWSIICCCWMRYPKLNSTLRIDGCNFTTYTQFIDDIAVFTYLPFLNPNK